VAELLQEWREHFPFLLPRESLCRLAFDNLGSHGGARVGARADYRRFSNAHVAVNANTCSRCRSTCPMWPLPEIILSCFLHVRASCNRRAVSGGSHLSSSPQSTSVGAVILETRLMVSTKNAAAAPGNGNDMPAASTRGSERNRFSISGS